MSYNIKELIDLPEQDKKEIIAELMESIVLNAENNLPEWKVELYKERLIIINKIRQKALNGRN